jgi:hypothetical protein
MSVVLTAEGNSGIVAIHTPNADILNPASNLSNILFHSDLDYLSINTVVNGSLSLPRRTANSSDSSSAYGSTTYTLYAHGLGFTPIVIGRNRNSKQPIVGDTMFQSAGTCNLRSFILGADSSYIYLREIYLNKDTSFGAFTLTYSLYLFNKSVGV